MAKAQEHTIECAVRADLSSPAAEFLKALAEGMWQEDVDATEFPDDEQVKDRDLFLSLMMHVARYGVPRYKNAINHLENGIWEFKVGKKRLSYFDTPGDGSYVPKPKETVRANSQHKDDDAFWWYPTLDETLRLGHAFPKTGEQTEAFDLTECDAVREEDVKHDQSE